MRSRLRFQSLFVQSPKNLFGLFFVSSVPFLRQSDNNRLSNEQKQLQKQIAEKIKQILKVYKDEKDQKLMLAATLSCRFREMDRVKINKSVLNDPFSEAIIHTLREAASDNPKIIFSRSNVQGQAFYLPFDIERFRPMLMDEIVVEWIEKHSATQSNLHIVELGAGLDFREERIILNNIKKIDKQWTETTKDAITNMCKTICVHAVDVAAVMILRESFQPLVHSICEQHPLWKCSYNLRTTHIGHDLLDPQTLELLMNNIMLLDQQSNRIQDHRSEHDFSHVLFVAEALFCHLNCDKAKDFVEKLAERFPGASLITDDNRLLKQDLKHVQVVKMLLIYDDKRVQRHLSLWFKLLFANIFRKLYRVYLMQFTS
ncbi:hypothetical protein RFI_04258 [Reticulomyxa filosa]|uniref:Uncharacterized protein n=1 Tax=Reticulomyxa filosa TaxID=46433 RepID=X6P2S0_RETFI|nr:hypothetical protein RFI_04258 [Reticulomyxa filosa]|eukprot:ETO32860.1 hypothetical protein RFI_04258 [Reticulomyxa filosa]